MFLVLPLVLGIFVPLTRYCLKIMLNGNLVGLFQCFQFLLLFQLLNLLVLTRTNALRDKPFSCYMAFTGILQSYCRVLSNGENATATVKPVSVLPGFRALVSILRDFIDQQAKSFAVR